MRIGIFGGSFNPPHVFHRKIAEYILDRGYVDKVIFVPTGIHYKYKTNLEPDKIRFQMLKLALEDRKEIEISDFEQREKLVYTYETLEHFRKLYSRDEIYFICGADNLSYIESWKNGKEILRNYKILVVGRPTDDLNAILKSLGEYRKNIEIVDLELNELSSSAIRGKINKGEDISDYVHPKVLSYINKNNLYRK